MAKKPLLNLLTPQDAEALPRLLRDANHPRLEAVIKEYNIRIQMFHSAGHSGPLGTIGLIDIIRHCKINPIGPPKPAPTEFKEMEAGTRVEVRRNGSWLPGNFVRVGSLGKIDVKVDEDESVTEWMPDQVREAGLVEA